MEIFQVMSGVTILMLTIPLPLYGQAQCSTTKLKGAYGYAYEGFVPDVTTSGTRYDPVSEVGIVEYGGNGMISVKASAEYHGQVANRNITGSYQVEGDCTGWATFPDSTGAKA